MAGERTPAGPPLSSSNNADDEISLREHMQRQVDNVQRQLDVIIDGASHRIGAVHNHADLEVAHLKEHMENILEERRLTFRNGLTDQRIFLERLISEHRIQLDERYATQTKALEVALAATDRATAERLVQALHTAKEFNVEQDKRYAERFSAQEKAVELALARVDKEFHEHLRAAREETQAALFAADKAIQKSETSMEKRFESVNEFRGQLSDQATTFMPRKEADVKWDSLTEKIDRNAQQLIALQLQLSSRLDVTQGEKMGGKEAIMDKRTANGAVLALVGMGITVILAVLTIVGFVIARMGP